MLTFASSQHDAPAMNYDSSFFIQANFTAPPSIISKGNVFPSIPTVRTP